MDSQEYRNSNESTLDKSPRYQAYMSNRKFKLEDKHGTWNISKVADDVKMFNIPHTQTYRKLADYCSSSRKNSLTKWKIKTKYKINGKRGDHDIDESEFDKILNSQHCQSQYLFENKFTQKHTYVNKQNRIEIRDKNTRRRSREFRNEEMRTNSKVETPKIYINQSKQTPRRNMKNHPIKITPADINRDIFKETKIPRISKKSIHLHDSNKSMSKGGIKRYMSTDRISRVRFSPYFRM